MRGSPFTVVSLRPVNEASLARIAASDDGTRGAVAGQWNELRLVLEPRQTLTLTLTPNPNPDPKPNPNPNPNQAALASQPRYRA